MGFYSGPTVVNDSLVFCFDAGSDKCTDADDAVASILLLLEFLKPQRHTLPPSFQHPSSLLV